MTVEAAARDQPGEVAVAAAAAASVGSAEQQETSVIDPQSHQVQQQLQQHSYDVDSSSDLALRSNPLKATLSKLSEQPSLLRQQSLAGLSVLSSFSVCRICHVGSWPKEPLISPCRCKGTLAYVHLTCLERWLNQSCRNYCELCNFRYNALETPRYKWFESLRIWVNHPRNRRHIKEDFLIFTLLTVFTAGLASICLLGNRHFVLEGSRVGFSETWTKGAIIFFMFIVISGYGASVYFLIKNQVMPWYNWWRGTVNIRLHFEQSSASSLEVEMPQQQQQYDEPADEMR